MSDYDRKKLIEVVLYILNKTGGIDYYRLFKIMYFAEMEHLAAWGGRITADEFVAIKYGPVPAGLYNAVKRNAHNANLDKLLWGDVELAGDDAPYVLLPKRAPNLRYISASEVAFLDKSIAENAKRLFSELKNLSHDKAWENACKRRIKIISPLDMARVAGATEATVEYIDEQLALDRALA
ncbi:MAG: SocA family protein [Prevotellaceae bacterium]|jgi:hypothetical protein|nr:SocA family protein [Prevotellaceae bacterium]